MNTEALSARLLFRTPTIDNLDFMLTLIKKVKKMKIFIAGSRDICALDNYTQAKLDSICSKGYEVLIGDCYGVDALVQTYLSLRKYEKVTVYASMGRTRNNVGNWNVRSIPPPKGIYGYRLYEMKDMAMADDADFGFMIWNGKSRGTHRNIERLRRQGKRVLVHLPEARQTYLVYGR